MRRAMRTGAGPTLAVLLLAPGAGGCDAVRGLLGGGAEEAVAQADALSAKGDLAAASEAWDAAFREHPDSVDAATGAAFAALLRGDPAAAERALAQVAPKAGDRAAEVELRRALVALRAGNLDAVAEHGRASGHPVGLLLAAEVALADGERDAARELLERARAGGGAVAEVAGRYIELVDDPEPLVSGLSEAQALWALGERGIAVRAVEELLKNLPEDGPVDREEQLLVWAGRAASVGETEVARALLDAVIFPPEGQAWRKAATLAIVACAEGDADTCARLLDGLEGGAPADGLADARATAAALVARSDPEAARRIAGRIGTSAAARALLEAGDIEAARNASPGGVLGTLLGG